MYSPEYEGELTCDGLLHAAPVWKYVAGPMSAEVAVARKRRTWNDERSTFSNRRQRRVSRQQLGEAEHVVHVVVAAEAVTGRRADGLVWKLQISIDIFRCFYDKMCLKSAFP